MTPTNKLLILLTILILNLAISSANLNDTLSGTQNVTLSLEQTEFSVYEGSSLRIICNGTNLLTDDIVWQSFPIGDPMKINVIYIYGQLVNAFQSKYQVHSYQASTNPKQVITSLTIKHITAADARFQYQCACNIYTACASGYKAKVEANITTMEATTTTTAPPFVKKVEVSICQDIAFNSIQYLFLFLDMFCLASISYVIVYQFHNSKRNFKIVIMSMALLVLVSLIIMIVLWMMPADVGKISHISLIIVCVGLVPCFLCLSIIYFYCIQLWQENRLKLVQILLISLDLVLETLSAALLIASNAVCGGTTTDPEAFPFNYAYLEIVGACFFFIFGGLLIFKVFLFIILKIEKNNFFIRTRDLVSNLHKNKLKIENLA